MSNDYFSNYQSFVSSRSMPSPAETPYETPHERPLPRSRRSSRRSLSRGLSRENSTSPPPLPSSSDSPRQGQADTAIFGMDPKRFTPTLHASLVSEILNLRRELDTKHRFITDLESNLENSQTENDNLADQLAQSTRESRQAEQRFKTLERGTLDAVEDLIRERDDARTATAELKSKLEALGKRGRKQEEDAVQSQQSWESEKQSWENERRQLERRVHVTESRLRSFIDEMGAHQLATEQQDQVSDAEREDSTFKDSGLGNDSDAGSVRSYRALRKHTRNQSSVSFRSIPRSADSPITGALASISLADELRFDEEDEYDLEESDHEDDNLLGDGHISRSASLRSAQSDSKAKKILGLADAPKGKTHTAPTSRDSTATITAVKPDDRKAKTNSGPQRTGSIPEMAAQLGLQLAGACLKYVDHGVQSSRPPSPAATPVRRDEFRSSNSSPGVKIEKWQLNAVGPDGATDAGAQDIDPVRAASLAIRQQRNVPLSPPETPIIRTNPVNDDINKSPTTTIGPLYASSSTQTEVAPSAPMTAQTETKTHPSRFSTTVDAIQIPSIAIHPPLSASTSSGPPVLPPGMADASAQTDNTLASKTCDASIQTEEIRIDRRPIKLPSHLLPSSLDSSRPANPVTRLTADSPEMKGPQISVPHRNNEKRPLKAISLPRPVLLASTSERGGDDPKPRQDDVSMPLTDISALLNSSANWTSPVGSSDEQGRENEQSDVFGTTPGLARYNTRTTFTGPPKTVPEDREISPAHQATSSSLVQASSSRRGSDESSNGVRPRNARVQRSISRSSRTGTFMHSRTPSDTSMGSSSYGTGSQAGPAQPPPFPVPLRSSSRSRVQNGPSSEASWSPTFRETYRPGHRRSHLDRNSVRKMHSSSSMNSSVRMSPRRRRRGPQLTPIQSMAFENPPIFSPGESDSVPQEDMPFSPVSEDGRDDQEADECAADDNNREDSLVEAIAATMVGEWMWKYVRRRKSFGVGDSTPGDDGMNSVRHKRWVWLSPYERTIMWSTKQPNSGIALLGKNGRKLVIKSVLDVKDETPLRKSASAEPVFDRSILIMAPERALKFTASSKERHYLWLTALSFLAESGRGPPQVPLVPASKPIEDTPQKQRRPSFPVRYGARRESARIAQVAQPLIPKPLPLFGDDSHDTSPTLCEAEPPSIPRVPGRGHQRKRSNSNPIMSPPTIPIGLRSFSSNAMSPTGNSGLAPTATKVSSYSQNVSALSHSESRHPSVASPEQPNFFEAMGTVRMEAFVDRNYHDGVLYLPAGPSMSTTKRNAGRGGSIASSTLEEKKGTGHVLDESGRDPFTGF